MIIIGCLRAIPIQVRVKPSPPENEHTLLQRVARKDRTALAEVYTRFQRPLFAYLFHLLGHKEQAEDILQEVMLVVWQKAHTVKGNGSMSGWIFGIAHHQAFKALRQPSRVMLIEIEAASMIPDTALEPEAHALYQASQEELTQALACLTPEHREVLELAFFQDFSYKEIAAIIGIPEGTVKSRLSYARRALKAALLRNGWEI
ncbi:RNA polymerase sigma factor [Ktedonospora formicarum]|uniref:RNA polymerase sigma factor n=1 Tax=Ktedonospora formicarum TaxID=2778364 RepID=A0A8J3I0Q0_9CHLR|nr:RNA polymerase sigma factor [Ktedonospora formicarum]GHO47837.1 RNA polymerase sigma factor [Ktedonospora formicarum]